MTAAGSSSHGWPMSIGSVLAELRGDFPDVTISKIRFLESEGLVQPDRTHAGYRQFSRTDVQRLRYILAAQRDHYLPLRVIKEQLDAMDRGVDDPPLGPAPPRSLAAVADAAGAPPGPDDLVSSESTRMTQEELLAEADISAATLTELHTYGLVRPGPAGFYDADALLVAKTVRAMSEFGLQPRHLRAFRASADREIGLLTQIVAPMAQQRDPDARARADEVIRELAALSIRLHTLLVKTGLRNTAL